MREYLSIFNYFVLVAALILRPVLRSFAVLISVLVLIGRTPAARSYTGFCGRFHGNWFLSRCVRLRYGRFIGLRDFLQT